MIRFWKIFLFSIKCWHNIRENKRYANICFPFLIPLGGAQHSISWDLLTNGFLIHDNPLRLILIYLLFP